MITQQTKLKRSTISKHTYFAQPIFIWLDKQDGVVMVSYSPDFDDIFPASIADLKPVNKGRSTISSKPKVLNDKEKTDKQKMDEFYSRIALRMPYECENCGQKLQAFNKFAKRSCAAHILEKCNFPSIAMNEDNILFLGAGFLGGCQCHNLYDSNVEARSKMKVFQIALNRFEKLKQYLTDKELIKAYTYLNLEWK